MSYPHCVVGCLGMYTLSANAATSASLAASSGPPWAGLFFVFVIIGLASWAARCYGNKKRAVNVPIKVVGACSLGGKERIAVIEVAGQWLVVGVAPGAVSALASMVAPAHLESDKETQSGSFAAALEKLTIITKPENNAH